MGLYNNSLYMTNSKHRFTILITSSNVNGVLVVFIFPDVVFIFGEVVSISRNNGFILDFKIDLGDIGLIFGDVVQISDRVRLFLDFNIDLGDIGFILVEAGLNLGDLGFILDDVGYIRDGTVLDLDNEAFGLNMARKVADVLDTSLSFTSSMTK